MTCRYGSMAAIALATMLVVGCSGPSRESLTVVSWGGAYAQAVRKGYIEPFVAETGVEVRLEDYNGGLAQVRAQVEAGSVHWDVVDFEIAMRSAAATKVYWSRSTRPRSHPVPSILFNRGHQLATSLEGRDESKNKRRNHVGMVPVDGRPIKFGARG